MADYPYPSREEFLERWMPSLPQASVIDREDAERWYSAAVGLGSPAKFAWHFRRLAGIGGSEVGEIVLWFRSQPNVFKTARDIVEEKLMKKPPLEPTSYMRRGIFFERIVRDIFHNDYGAESLNDYLELFSDTSHPEYPFLYGTPDDVVRMGGDMVYIVDYKTSSQVPSSPPLIYAAQLMLYSDMLALRRGEKPENYGRLLVYLDYAKGDAVVLPVLWDEYLMREIKASSHVLWEEYVMKGRLPEISPAVKSDVYLDEAVKNHIKELDAKATVLDVVVSVLQDTKKGLEKSIIEDVREILPDGESFSDIAKELRDCMVSTIGVRRKVDRQRADEIAASFTEEERRRVQKLTGELDAEKVKKYLLERGERLEDFLVVDYDVDRLTEVCREKGIEPPVLESVYFSRRESMVGRRLGKDVLDRIKSLGYDISSSVLWRAESLREPDRKESSVEFAVPTR